MLLTLSTSTCIGTHVRMYILGSYVYGLDCAGNLRYYILLMPVILHILLLDDGGIRHVTSIHHIVSRTSGHCFHLKTLDYTLESSNCDFQHSVCNIGTGNYISKGH